MGARDHRTGTLQDYMAEECSSSTYVSTSSLPPPVHSGPSTVCHDIGMAAAWRSTICGSVLHRMPGHLYKRFLVDRRALRGLRHGGEAANACHLRGDCGTGGRCNAVRRSMHWVHSEEQSTGLVSVCGGHRNLSNLSNLRSEVLALNLEQSAKSCKRVVTSEDV